MAFNLGGSCWWWGCPFFPLFFIPPISTFFFPSLPLCLLFLAPFSRSLCIIYSHFLAIKMERCCRIFACSATLQCWWIILHPANWKASLSFMSALCWFTIKTYCTMLWVQGLALQELAKRKKWGWSRYMYICFRVMFFSSIEWGSFWVTYVSYIYLCLWLRFIVHELLYLCLLSSICTT